MRLVTVVTVLGVIATIFWFVISAGRIAPVERIPESSALAEAVADDVQQLDQWFSKRWEEDGIRPAKQADDLEVLRRLSLALHGSVPSLEEIRNFQRDKEPHRLERWVDEMLADERFADYFAERLARSLVGTDGGAFVVYRRDRLKAWLVEQLKNRLPWPEIVTQLIAADGLWTDRPQANFITSAQIPDEGIDENKLAGRTVRAFLGQRMDCAQCHDHPFDPRWKQHDFEGIAAMFGQVTVNVGGVHDQPVRDGKPVEYRVVDPGDEGEDGRLIEPHVPFNEEWLPESGTRRQRLAAWVVHPANRRFERATANRVWGLMFGAPLMDPVDDLPHPEALEEADALDLLGQTFRKYDGQLSALVRVIALSRVFQLSSEDRAESEDEYYDMKQEWAVFPLVRLRPEQVVGSLFQVGSVRTVDQESHLFVRIGRATSENDFLKEYGDLGDDELMQQVGTIPQALLRMNGKFTREAIRTELLTSATQLINYSPSDTALIDNIYLTCLCRFPSTEERQELLEQLPLADGRQRQKHDEGTAAEVHETTKTQSDPAMSESDPITRGQFVSDLYWSLLNSAEFSWNH
ncbi:MAG: DUF1549 domain-containing protein [Planctomycetaceae bacterium]|nr:DUF1549 domain-containing protein [Planctomycetaceae bacterium]